ncbi:putative leucine-rich repeat receptor-like protein kinase family protein [Panicum miliaceum]|uniref:non-specific serine/threonine protein kinase n=1 Tax=Panicum miliaceum TaxID=4540 RepID=A0A3L6PWY3_PANMI|nr:putative leucine-rich repeat receptor-like protein kinase family protein [Panicum miliaceum]
MTSKWSSGVRGLVLSMLLSLLVASAGAQQASPRSTDPVEVNALNAVFDKLELKLWPAWISGDPCAGAATNGTNIDIYQDVNPGIRCDCSDHDNTVCHIFQLNLCGKALSGSVPKELGNLVNLINLCLGTNNLNGSLPSELGNLVKLEELYIDSAGLSGPIPSSFSKLTSMKRLVASDNEFTGRLPDYIGRWSNLQVLRFQGSSFQGPLPTTLSNLVNLTDIDFSYNQLSGSFPSWASQNLQLNLVANNFVINNSSHSVLPSGLECLQRNTSCLLGPSLSTSFAVDCGSNRSISGSDNSMYQPDVANVGPASYYVTEARTWGVSNVGKFMDASNSSYIIHSSRKFQSTSDSELFQTARMSPSSLRYYGVGLENGNYAGELKEQDFDIRKEAGGRSYTVVKKQYIVPVTRNFLEVHLFWAGKGTCCVPSQGHYGPAISALSATLITSPEKSIKTGVIVGAVVGAVVFGLVVLAGLYVCRHKRRKVTSEQQELYSIVGKPNVFSYSYGELRSAADNFSSSNLLGEGGYGSVYKGKLPNGSVVAVKQLSETSRQGKKQFIAEIETISQVQHRNLVKLYGCCLEGDKPLLVYEYLENGSLDKALFGSGGGLNLDWPTQYEICLGIARGLAYLHEESSVRVVHRDIKASNVLLDANLNPKISDFGLAKLCDDKKTHVSTKVAGTFGYLAPEYAMRGHMTEKVDVFAFGVVMLEIITGRQNYDDRLDEDTAYLLEWVWQLYEEDHPLDAADPRLTEFNSDEALRAIRVALLCIQSSPRQRPPMSRVASMLAGDVELAEAITKSSYVIEWQMNSSRGQSSSTSRGRETTKSSSPFLSSAATDESR